MWLLWLLITALMCCNRNKVTNTLIVILSFFRKISVLYLDDYASEFFTSPDETTRHIVTHNLQVFMLLLVLAVLDIPEKVKAILVYGCLLFMSCPLMVHQQLLKEVQEKPKILPHVLVALMNAVQVMIMSVIVKYSFKKISLNHFKSEKQKAETQIILDNVGEAVITHSDNGIHFVNQSAVQLLRSAVQQLPDYIRPQCLHELECLRKN